MSTSTIGLFVRHLALSEGAKRLKDNSDRDLLAAYQAERSEAAFTELMRRYEALVLRTCRRVLGRGPDAEDVFQATFILLARKAGQLGREAVGSLSLGGWLHRVAYRTALNVVTGTARRKARERQANVMALRHPSCSDPAVEATWNELQPILDAELDALPEEARRLLIACYLHGKSYTEEAAELGLPRSSLAWRLGRARALLAARLARRGITVSSALLAVLLEETAKGAGVSAVLRAHTLQAATTFNGQAAGVISARAANLVRGALASMTKSSTRFGLLLAGWLSLLGIGLVACQTLKAWPDQPPESEPPAAERLTQEGDKPARTDRYGDPLPSGALARLGTVRLRHATGVHSLAFTCDGKGLITAGQGEPARLWDLGSGRIVRQFGDRRDNQVYVVALSPDGRTLAVAGEGDTVRLLETASGKERTRFAGHGGDVTTLSFAPDGRRLVSGSRDTTLLVWDVTGRLQDGRLRPAQLSDKEMEKLWVDLAADDARRAGRALWILVAVPDRTVPYLAERLRTSAADTHKALAKVPQFLRDLDDDAFAVRVKAKAELARLGAVAEPALRQALAKSPSLETRRSLEQLLKALEAERQVPSGESLRGVRALEVLEQIGTREARATLQSLTAGAEAESALTHEACIALERLKRAGRQ